MKRWIPVLCCLLLLSGCGSSPHSREVGSTAILGVLGVENVPQGLKVWAAAQSGEESPSPIYQGTGITPADAIEALSERGQRKVSSAHVEHILLAQGAEKDLWSVLSYAFQDPRQSTESQLWVVRTPDLSKVFTKEADPLERLSVLKTLGKDAQGFRPLTLREAASCLAAGEPFLLPALEMGEDGLYFVGFALYHQGNILTWLTEEEALGASLLLGKQIHWMGTAGSWAMSLQSLGCQVEPVWTEDRLTGLALRCCLEGVLTGGWDSRPEVISHLEKTTASAIKQGLDAMQKAGFDGTGLKARAGLSQPLSWQRLSHQWEDAFPQLETTVKVTLTVAERY